MPRGQFSGTYAELLYSMPAAGAALANSTTRTVISGNSATNSPFYLPASFIPPGSLGVSFKVIARGFYSTTGTPTLIIAAALDTTQNSFGTTLAATGAYTTESGATNAAWELEFDCVANAAGTSGTLATAGVYTHGAAANAATAAAGALMVGSSTAIAINTTVNNWIEVWATWGTPSASNTITCTQMMVYGLN